MSTPGTDQYGWSSTDAPHSTHYISPVVLRALRRLGVRRVLDLGSGNGSFSDRLRQAGFDVVGVEVDQQGVDIARRTHPAVPFHRYSVDDDPGLLLQHESAFDAVVSTEVIEHLYSPHRLATYAHATLKSGGYLLITTPFHGYLKNLALSLMNKWDHHHTVSWHGGHIKFFSRATLSALLTDNGFEVIEFQGIGRLPWLWKSMLIVARKKN